MDHLVQGKHRLENQSNNNANLQTLVSTYNAESVIQDNLINDFALQLDTAKDNSRAIFRDIIAVLPEKFSQKEVTNFIKKGDCERFKHGYTDKLTPKKKPFTDMDSMNLDYLAYQVPKRTKLLGY